MVAIGAHFALAAAGAALFMLISKYGFTDVLEPRLVVLDPSRVAAQIVTGVGFLGAGLIFVRGDSVRGLTTAASIWVTAAIGSASGAGLPVLAALTTGIYFLVVLGFPLVTRRLPRSATAMSAVQVRYPTAAGSYAMSWPRPPAAASPSMTSPPEPSGPARNPPARTTRIPGRGAHWSR
jgi:putative Mg2+ transporter-C (MgtC) family protein